MIYFYFCTQKNLFANYETQTIAVLIFLSDHQLNFSKHPEQFSPFRMEGENPGMRNMFQLFLLLQVWLLSSGAEALMTCSSDGEQNFIFIKEISTFIYCNSVFCVPGGECNGFLIARERLDKLDKSTPEYAELLGDLKGLVCNKEERKICCEGKIM